VLFECNIRGFGVNADEQQWHWAEGNKYALEGMRSILLLNGGGALALLTFFGNRTRPLTGASADAIGNSLLFFGIGTVESAIVFLLAYLTQLHYGNEGFEGRAARWHNLTYLSVFVAVASFVAGVWFARQAVIAALV
jgi:hypothetical protein